MNESKSALREVIINSERDPKAREIILDIEKLLDQSLTEENKNHIKNYIKGFDDEKRN